MRILRTLTGQSQTQSEYNSGNILNMSLLCYWWSGRHD